MEEFGHLAAIGGGFCIDTWGGGPFEITVAGKSWRFEDSDRFGPAILKGNGDLAANPYPGERSRFWRAHRIWVRQGRRVADDGITAIWDEPAPTTYRRIAQGFRLIVSNGDEDGALIEVFNPAPQEGLDHG